MDFSYSTILIILAIVLLPIAVMYFKKQQTLQEERNHDPRSNITPNNTNYNIDGILSEDKLQNASQEEIKEIIRKVDAGDLSSLSDEDYYRLKERLNQAG